MTCKIINEILDAEDNHLALLIELDNTRTNNELDKIAEKRQKIIYKIEINE